MRLQLKRLNLPAGEAGCGDREREPGVALGDAVSRILNTVGPGSTGRGIEGPLWEVHPQLLNQGHLWTIIDQYDIIHRGSIFHGY